MSTNASFTLILRALRYAYALSRTVQAIFLLVILINSFVIRFYTVEGHSMLPTLQPSQHLFVNKLAYLEKGPAVGDIVIIQYRQDSRITLVKRIAGLPGSVQQTDLGPVTLGSNQYFVRGDNPPQSTDSRTFGPVDRSNIIGKVMTGIKIPF